MYKSSPKFCSPKSVSILVGVLPQTTSSVMTTLGVLDEMKIGVMSGSAVDHK
jgi:hypothetical protein